MPAVSKAQNRFMRAAAANPRMARRMGISSKAAKKFVADSKGQSVSALPERKKKP